MTKTQSQKQRFHVALRPEVAKNLKLTAVKHDIFPGDVVEAGLLLVETLTPQARAELLAGFDVRGGRILARGEIEAEAVRDGNAAHHVRAYKLEAGIDPEADDEEA